MNDRFLSLINHPLYSFQAVHDNSQKQLLYLNKQQIKVFEFKEGMNLLLTIGFSQLSVEVVLQDFDISPNKLYLSTEAFYSLSLYHGQPLSLVFFSSNRLVVGPTLGLTVSKNNFNNIEQSTALRKRAQTALEKGVLFFCFYLDDVDWEQNLVEAAYLNPSNYKWAFLRLPVAQIIYDRGSIPNLNTINSFSTLGSVHNLLWINSTRTFNKWDTFQALNNSKKTAHVMPQTAKLSLSLLEKFIVKNKYTYVKGNYGRSGRQVYRIEKKGQNYLCKTGGSLLKTWEFKCLRKLFMFLQNRVGKDAILQKGVTLATIDSNPFDMRVLIQKNINNHWNLSALNFRIAKPDAIITNFAAGSKDILKLPGEKLVHPNLSWEKLECFSLKIVSAMEKYFGPLGEIGLDIALDKQRRLWLIEANSRPSSIAYRNASRETYSKKIFGLPIDYGIFLLRQFYSNLE